MSVQALGWVLDYSDTTGSDRLVLIALANHVNKNTGSCNPGYDLLAHEARVHRATAIRCVNSLEQEGHITVVRNGGRHKVNEYCIVTDKDEIARLAAVAGEKQSQSATSETVASDDASDATLSLETVASDPETVASGQERVAAVRPEPVEPLEPNLFTARGLLTPVPDFSPDSSAPSGRSRERKVDPVWQAFADANKGVVGNRKVWSIYIAKLKALPGVTVSDIVRAIKRAERTWNQGKRHYDITPMAVHRRWSKLHEPLPEGRTKEYALPDHKSWMDHDYIEFPDPPPLLRPKAEGE
jgi:hypothetical protein